MNMGSRTSMTGMPGKGPRMTDYCNLVGEMTAIRDPLTCASASRDHQAMSKICQSMHSASMDHQTMSKIRHSALDEETNRRSVIAAMTTAVVNDDDACAEACRELFDKAYVSIEPLMCHAVHHNMPQILPWLIDKYKFSPWWNNASRYACLESLKLIHAGGVAVTDPTLSHAVIENQTDKVEWYLDTGLPTNEWACNYAAREGHVSTLKYLVSRKCLLSSRVYNCIALGSTNTVEVLEYVYNLGVPFPEDANELLVTTIQFGNVKAIKWFTRHGVKSTESLLNVKPMWCASKTRKCQRWLTSADDTSGSSSDTDTDDHGEISDETVLQSRTSLCKPTSSTQTILHV